jgi:catechol 2,3-dioxygenase-like lactoylglutathione lyase family enzyme
MRNLLIACLSAVVLVGCSSGQSGRADNAVVRGVHYVGVSVSDLERSKKFYGDVVNLEEVSGAHWHEQDVLESFTGESSLGLNSAVMKSVNAQLRLMEFDAPSDAAKNTGPMDVFGPGIAHLCFQVHDKTETYQKFLSFGGKHIGSPQMWKNPKTQVSYAYGHDLDNAIVEIEHVDVAALNLEVPPKNDRRIRHISLATPDIDRAVDFYAHLLQERKPRRTGWFNPKGDAVDMVTGQAGSELKFAWFQVRNLELEIIQYVSHPTKKSATPRPVDALGYNMIVFDVSDMQITRERLLTAGADIISEDKKLDGESIIFARDPDGNLLGFQTLPDTSPLSAQKFSGNGL